jgi:hypothetical protein
LAPWDTSVQPRLSRLFLPKLKLFDRQQLNDVMIVITIGNDVVIIEGITLI